MASSIAESSSDLIKPLQNLVMLTAGSPPVVATKVADLHLMGGYQSSAVLSAGSAVFSRSQVYPFPQCLSTRSVKAHLAVYANAGITCGL
jgi:hypothetical protein